ncbi:MAG: hypothetical protein WC457_04700 [Patescibacteria group bacterium]
MKKQQFLRIFAATHNPAPVEFFHKGARFGGKPRGMRNIVLRGEEPFNIMIGFWLKAPIFGEGFYCYNRAESRYANGTGQHIAVVNTHFGNKPVLFQFLLDRKVAGGVHVTSSDEDQTLAPSSISKRHFFQRARIYGS